MLRSPQKFYLIAFSVLTMFKLPQPQTALAFTYNIHTKTKSPSRCRLPLSSTQLHVFSPQKMQSAFNSISAAFTSFPLSMGISPGFRRIPTQFVAALGDPNAKCGTNAHEWGLWELDPGPRGVFLRDFERLKRSGGVAPSGWKLDQSDWWLDEHGLIMEPPVYSLPAGQYLVTGGRQVTSVLSVCPPSEKESGQQQWSLSGGATLQDVTHLPCRAARYKPNELKGSPATACQSDFPVAPGATMPDVKGCAKQDYAVLLVVGVKD